MPNDFAGEVAAAQRRSRAAKEIAPAATEATEETQLADASIAARNILDAAVLAPIVERVRTDVTAVKKANGPAWTGEALTPELLRRHLNRGEARGCCPIKAGESVTRLALLDLDSHKGETPWSDMQAVAQEVMGALELLGMCPIPFRSSGGRGIHLFMLWNDPQDAYSVRYFLRNTLTSLGYKDGAAGVAKQQIEVLPKQDSVEIGRFGNMFILPLAGKSEPLDPAQNLAPMGREWAEIMAWPTSAPVPVAEKPQRASSAPAAAIDAGMACKALAAIPNNIDDRKEWFKLMCAFKEAAGEDGYHTALDWSAHHPSHDEGKFNKTWDSIAIGRENGAPAEYLFSLAGQHGFTEHVAQEFSDEGPATEPPHFAFYAYLPTHQYLHRPTRAFWPAASVDGSLTMKIEGKRASQWLDAFRAVQQATWHPAHGELLLDTIVADGGFVPKPGAKVYNRYRPPVLAPSMGDVAPWLNHLGAIYPGEAAHLIKWFAQRIQRPGEKINHALVLGGAQGIGKDTILEPVRRGVGPWNWADIDPKKLTGAFNPFVESVVLRINEARDLGDLDRFAFYDHSKTYIAAPPDILMCNNKHQREYPVFNVMGVILTTNHKTNGIYLPLDDRRHYVAWSNATKDDFAEDYWRGLWGWLDAGGAEAVVGYLRAVDLSDFDPKAPPPKTEAFYAIVQANANPDDLTLAGLMLREDGSKLPAVTLNMVVQAAIDAEESDLAYALSDTKNRRRVPHMMEKAGYVPVRNEYATDGLWKIDGRRQVIYGDAALSTHERAIFARSLLDAGK